MDRSTWHKPVSNREAARRAGGRAAYNRRRQVAAELRRNRLVELALRHRLSLYEAYGKRRLAEMLAVSVATINRDIQTIHTTAQMMWRCPICNGFMDAPHPLWGSSDGMESRLS